MNEAGAERGTALLMYLAGLCSTMQAGAEHGTALLMYLAGLCSTMQAAVRTLGPLAKNQTLATWRSTEDSTKTFDVIT